MTDVGVSMVEVEPSGLWDEDAVRVALVGPSRVGKTTLLTAILSETERLLAGTPVSVVVDEQTDTRVRRNRRDLRRAIELREFDAAALAGNRAVSHYRVALVVSGSTPGGGTDVEVPFYVLDYPGGWLDPERRGRSSEAREQWPQCQAHIRNSVMLLVPIDSAVLMEASTPTQRAAVLDLLALEDVERMGREWAKSRNASQGRDEPAVLVLAPLKCEKYFDDNGGRGRRAAELRQRVRERYSDLISIVREETTKRALPVRFVYAPVDTYGCAELMEARWTDEGGDHLEFTAHYAFRGQPPQLSVKAAGTVMQELCRCVMEGRERLEALQERDRQAVYDRQLDRKLEDKGFLGTISYYVSGEAWDNRMGRQSALADVSAIQQRRAILAAAMRQVAAADDDPRVEIWEGDGVR
jgi:hypothetical protein